MVMKTVISESQLRFYEVARNEIERITIRSITEDYYGLFPFELRRLEMKQWLKTLEMKYFHHEKFDFVSVKLLQLMLENIYI